MHLTSPAPEPTLRTRHPWRRRGPRSPVRTPAPDRHRQPLHRHWNHYQRWRRALWVLVGMFALCATFAVRAGQADAEQVQAGQVQDGQADAQPSQESLVRLEDAGAGSLLFRTGTAGLFREAPRLQTDVDFDINGLVAQVTVRQEFRNESKEWVEGVYVFPLPEMAAVNALKMQIGERVIIGEIQEKQQARKTYEAARKSGKRASLVEQERPNLFTTSVANLGPGETIVVEIRYLETLQYENGGFEMRFPLTITPRYIPGSPLPDADRQGSVQVAATGWSQPTDQVPDADRITPPQAYDLPESTQMATLRGRIRAGFHVPQLLSPHHALDTRLDGLAWEFSLAGGPVVMNRDFLLRWRPEVGKAPEAALFAEHKDGADYALLMLMPPQSRSVKHLPREVIFVIDTSGSMSGTSIRQAREALVMALQRLRPEDRFNVFEFNSDYSRLFPEPVHGTPRNLQVASRFVRDLEANGGTEMSQPLEAALQGGGDEAAFLRQVIFITDGSIGNEEALFGIIRQKLASSRLFMVGIGSAPNAFFMNKAAQFGRGTATFVGDLDEVSEQMESLFRKIESPVVTDLRVDWGSAETETWPRNIRDLYAGEPLVVTARLASLPESVRVHGKLDGQAWQRDVRVAVAPRRIEPLASKGGGAKPMHAGQSVPTQNGVGTLWARNKIAALMDEERTQGKNDTLRRAIIDVAQTHALVTAYTSFVAVDRTPARPDDQALNKRAVPNRMPHGSTMTGFPRGATPAGLQILAGLFLLLLGFALARRTANPSAPGLAA